MRAAFPESGTARLAQHVTIASMPDDRFLELPYRGLHRENLFDLAFVIAQEALRVVERRRLRVALSTRSTSLTRKLMLDGLA